MNEREREELIRRATEQAHREKVAAKRAAEPVSLLDTVPAPPPPVPTRSQRRIERRAKWQDRVMRASLVRRIP